MAPVQGMTEDMRPPQVMQPHNVREHDKLAATQFGWP